MMDWLQLIEKIVEQFFPRFILTVCKLQPEILINIIKYPLIVKMYNQCIFYNIKNFWLKLNTVRINPRKNCAPVFSIANHQQFCNIFSRKYWVGYFFWVGKYWVGYFLLVQVFFFLFRIALQELFFSKSPIPPPQQKLNGQPLTRNSLH